MHNDSNVSNTSLKSLFNHTVSCDSSHVGWGCLAERPQHNLNNRNSKLYFAYWITQDQWTSSVFWQQNEEMITTCSGRWLWNMTWLNTNKHTVTLWNPSCEISTPLSSCMSQAVIWTSECKAISSSVLPPPHPHLISSIPKQKLLLWEKCSATYVSVWSPKTLASGLFGRQHVCIQRTEHFSFNQTVCEMMICSK